MPLDPIPSSIGRKIHVISFSIFKRRKKIYFKETCFFVCSSRAVSTNAKFSLIISLAQSPNNKLTEMREHFLLFYTAHLASCCIIVKFVVTSDPLEIDNMLLIPWTTETVTAVNVVLCCLPASNVGFCRVSRSNDCFCVVVSFVSCWLRCFEKLFWLFMFERYWLFYSMKVGNVVCVLTYSSCWRHLLSIYLELGFIFIHTHMILQSTYARNI